MCSRTNYSETGSIPVFKTICSRIVSYIEVIIAATSFLKCENLF